jgi:translation initiation factor eIF-2B subunit gamma
LDFVALKDQQQTVRGTAEVLLKLRDRIKADALLVISCDAIVDPACIPPLAMLHRARCASLTMLLAKKRRPGQPSAPAPAPSAAAAPAAPAVSSTKIDEETTDFIGFDEATGRVLHFESGFETGEVLRVGKRVLASSVAGGCMSVRCDLLDAHVYVLSRWVLDLIAAREASLRSLKADVVPWLVRAQFSAKLQDGLPESAAPATKPMCGSMTHASRQCDAVGVYAHVVDGAAALVTRANTIAAFTEANREIARGVHVYVPWEAADKNKFISVTATVDQQTQVGPECVVGDASRIGGRCGIRRSVIGKNCTIGATAKITNSVIMDSVVIGDGATVSDSIVCPNAQIRPKVTVKDSKIGAGCEIKEDVTGDTKTLE